MSGTTRRRGSSTTSVGSSASNTVITDAAAPPALPEYALPAAVKVFSRERRDGDTIRSPQSPDGGYAAISSRTATSASTGLKFPPTPLNVGPNISSSIFQPSEATVLYHQITEMVSKRISTLQYLRKAHEGRVYWFNTYLLDKPDLARMPYFEAKKLSRKATNFLFLGLSIPTINDLYCSSPIELLRCLNSLLSEFESFQQLHSETSTTLARARLPNMFRRPGNKSRRSTSAADNTDETQYLPAAAGTGAGGSAPSVMNFAASESDLLPGEEYTYLLTPSLPFEPDFFETFATLCDVVIDCYTRFLSLMPTPRETSAPVAELFSKVDSKLRKIIVQGIVKDFEDHSRSHVKTEVASIGKVVLSGFL